MNNSACEGCKGLAVPEAAVTHLLPTATWTTQSLPYALGLERHNSTKPQISEPSLMNGLSSASGPCNSISFLSCLIFQLGKYFNPGPC